MHLAGVIKSALNQHALALPFFAAAIAQRPAAYEVYRNRAWALKALGRNADAHACFAEAIRINPRDWALLNDFGLLQHETGRFSDAIEAYNKALSINPQDAGIFFNKGNACRALNDNAGALECYEQAVAIRRDHYKALIGRGAALRALGRPEEALASADRALALVPDSLEGLLNRGMTLRQLKRFDEALASYDRALLLNPDFPEVFNNRGAVLLDLKRPEDALGNFERALALKPDYPEALNNCGNALRLLKRYEEALARYDRALTLKPDYAEALNNRGMALLNLKRPDAALASHERALLLKPDYADALNNCGSALKDLKRYADAASVYSRLLEMVPDYTYLKGEILHARMLCCDWIQFESLAKSIENDVRGGKKSVEPFEYLGVSGSAGDLKRSAEIYSADRFPRPPTRLWNGERYDNARIRIGYVAGEFRHHATSILMIELFERHDKNRFELIAFDNGWDDASEIRGRVNRAFDEIVDISRLPDPAAATIIRQRQIDILVDLNGYVGEQRHGVFGHKPCPVQVNYLGFPGTLGADCIDYIIADRCVIPEEHQMHYTENVVCLPDTFQVNDSKRRIAERAPTRAEAGLPERGFVFCCFNNNYKITPAVFDVWIRLLNSVESSVLWLLEDTAAASRNLKREAGARGVAAERLVFAPRVGLDEHLARHRLADLFLDTLPCNAHTTASDALWAGLPLLTCLGTTFAGRVAASLLNAIGLPELIAHDLDNYEALALRLATAPDMLDEIKARLARNRTTHPLFDTDRFRRHIEAAYITMWERYQRGEPPESFAVPPM